MTRQVMSFYSTRRPDRLFIEKNASRYRLSKEIASRFSAIPVEMIGSIKGLGGKARVEDQKRCLALAVNEGSSVKEFRRMDGLVQRKEYYIYFAQNCPYDCQYCFLQCYTENSVPTIFVNQRKILRETKEVLKKEPKPYFYTGEMADSLMFDALTDFNLDLIRLFGIHPNGILELRTKCVDVRKILTAKPLPNVVLSWTFSPQAAIDRYEKGTPPLRARIEAAKRCAGAGFPIGIRLDPIIAYKGWETGYGEMLSEIFAAIPAARIESVVLGVFRFHPALEEIVRSRFPKSDMTINEFVPCVDGKLRYFKPVRINIYRTIAGKIRQMNAAVKVSLCMETPEVWEAVIAK